MSTCKQHRPSGRAIPARYGSLHQSSRAEGSSVAEGEAPQTCGSPSAPVALPVVATRASVELDKPEVAALPPGPPAAQAMAIALSPLPLPSPPPFHRAGHPSHPIPPRSRSMNSLSQLLAALDAVQGHFSAVVPSQQAAEQAEAAACLLYESVQGASPRDIADAWEFIQEE